MSRRRRLRRCSCWRWCRKQALAFRLKRREPVPDNARRHNPALRYDTTPVNLETF